MTTATDEAGVLFHAAAVTAGVTLFFVGADRVVIPRWVEATQQPDGGLIKLAVCRFDGKGAFQGKRGVILEVGITTRAAVLAALESLRLFSAHGEGPTPEGAPYERR